MPPPSPHPLPRFPLPLSFFLSFFRFFFFFSPVSLAHFTLVRRPSRASHFFASCQPTNQAAKSFSDVAPTDKWSALGLPACGHYWSMRFSLPFPLLSLPFLPSFSPPVSRAPLPPSSFTPLVFTFYFTSRSFIIFLISSGYPFPSVTIVGNGVEVEESMASSGFFFEDLDLRAIVHPSLSLFLSVSFVAIK